MREFLAGVLVVPPVVSVGTAVRDVLAARSAPPAAGRSFMIATPVDDGHKLCFWESVRRFERAVAAGFGAPHRFEVVVMPGDSLVPRARNNLFHRWLAHSRADYLFPIDSDLDFAPEDPVRIANLIVGRDLDFVAGRYAIKQPELRWCENGIAGTKPDTDGLIEIACAPGGIHCISRRSALAVVRRAAEWAPWAIRYTDDQDLVERWNVYFNGVVVDRKEWPDRPLGRYLSEDWGISYLWRKMGFRIWCDTRTIMLHRGEIFYPLGAKRLTAEETAAGVEPAAGGGVIARPARTAAIPV